jgi:hypothetical protein
MRIYYFGELIEENGRKVKSEAQKQMQLEFSQAEQTPMPKKSGMDSIGDILKELDLNLDSLRSIGMRQTSV